MSVDQLEARRMRKEGKTLQEIGDHFGVTRERIRQLVGPAPVVATYCEECSEPLPKKRHPRRVYCSRKCSSKASNRRKRQRTQSPCLDCGTPSMGDRCYRCKRAGWEADRTARFDRLAALWSEGLSMKQIAAEFGTTLNAIGVEIARARAAGWSLPRRRGKEPKAENLTKSEARFQLSQAIRQRTIRRPQRCESCGEVGPVDGHHHDYQRPLYVTWLCPPCHHKTHAELREDEPEEIAA